MCRATAAGDEIRHGRGDPAKRLRLQRDEAGARPLRGALRHARSQPAGRQQGARALEKEGQRAYDLALWRAAQLALAGGFSQLSIGPSHRDQDVKLTTRYQPTAPGVYGPGGMIYPQWVYNPLVNYYGLPGIGPYWAYEDPFAEGPDITARGRIKARLEARFAYRASPGSLDAKATESRLAAEYGASAY